jgi:hypothetical protein
MYRRLTTDSWAQLSQWYPQGHLFNPYGLEKQSKEIKCAAASVPVPVALQER